MNPEIIGLLLLLLNTFRGDNNQPPVSLSPLLNTYAQQRCYQQGAQGFITHNGLIIGVGENLAAGFPTAQSAMEGWISSPGHRDNMLLRHYTDVGLAQCLGRPPYRIYWVQIFGVPRKPLIPQGWMSISKE